jgi:TfoX/Sxy family transcriptional regulator of competence genes
MIMQVPRPTEDAKERFRALVPDDPRVEVKPMFGNLGAFVNGNMFMGLFGSDIGVKVSSADEERVRAEGGGPYGPAERPMSGWVTLPLTATAEDTDQWIRSALSFVGSQPPKQSKKRSS